MTWSDDPLPPHSPPPPAPAGGDRSAGRVSRLTDEWRQLRRAFAYHPHVTLTPLRGDPPSEFQIDYRVKTLVADDAGGLQYATTASMHLWLPPGFPAQPPEVRPLTPIFHPNVAWEEVQITPPWNPSQTAAGLIEQIGGLLAFHLWDPFRVANPAAMQWVNANNDLLPLDADADFSPNAGGDPVARITRFGYETLETVDRSIAAFRDRLLDPDAPDAAAVRDFVRRSRAALGVFLAPDLPPDLRDRAAGLGARAGELLTAAPEFEKRRATRGAAVGLREAAAVARDAAAALHAELDRLAAVVDAGELSDAAVALKLIPAAPVLSAFQLSLPKFFADAERREAAVRTHLAGGADGPADDDTARDLADARAEAGAAAAAVGTAVARGRAEQAALDRIVRWRGYVDYLSTGRALERRLAGWGAAGVQAYFIESRGERFGPYQLEQPVDLGGSAVVVRNLVRGRIEVRDADDDRPLGGGNDGTATIPVSAPGVASPVPAAFHLTERCDDLLVQFDFLRRQTAEDLTRKEPEAGYAAASWCGEFCRLLAKPANRAALKRELSKVLNRWRQLMLDLAALGPFKERLATYFLLTRAAGIVPRRAEAAATARIALREAEARLAEIARRSTRDLNTNVLLVPPALLPAHARDTQAREAAAATILDAATIIPPLVQMLAARLDSPKLQGRAAVPLLAALAAMPPEFAALSMGDDLLAEQVGRLEKVVQSLPADLAPAAGPAPAGMPPPGGPADESLAALGLDDGAEDGAGADELVDFEYDPAPAAGPARR